MAMALALGLPARLDKLADALELRNRKDAGGQKLMYQMSKPRRPRKDEDANVIHWFDDDARQQRLRSYNVQDVEVEREAYEVLRLLAPAEQAIWRLSSTINDRGFHVDRNLAEAARRIAQAAGPEIDAELAEITGGAVTAIAQVERLKTWLLEHGCPVETLDKKVVERLLAGELLPTGTACAGAAPGRSAGGGEEA